MAITVQNPPLALIAGPTASGKSALALALAARTGGVIINADSAQVYRDLRVLSAAPGEEELSGAEYRLYGLIDGGRPCSAADWAQMARCEIEQVQSQGRLPILAGGTGLYLRTLLEGIAPVPPIDADIRHQVRGSRVEDNRARLQDVDTEAAARLGPGDSARIARALEVVLSTGKPLKDWQARRRGGIGQRVQVRPLILLPPRDWLYARCDHRFERMIEEGAAEEVQALLGRGLNPSLPVMRAIGVREIAAWLRGDMTREQAIAAGQRATRRYAKRQYTWFAHQPPAQWTRLDKPLDRDTLPEALALLEMSNARPG